MIEIPIIYDIDHLSFKPRTGFGCIYKYTLDNSQEYVGQTRRNMCDRHWMHVGSSTIHCKLCDSKLRKHKYVLTIIYTCPTPILNDAEVYFISKYQTMVIEGGLNCTPGGQCSPMKGKRFTEDHKRKLSESNKGKHNGPRTMESRRKQSITLMGHSTSETTKRKIKMSSPLKKPIAQYTLEGQFIARFDSITDAVAYNNLPPNARKHIGGSANGEKNRPSAYGYIWKFV